MTTILFSSGITTILIFQLVTERKLVDMLFCLVLFVIIVVWNTVIFKMTLEEYKMELPDSYK